MEKPVQFRSSLGGFNREDVVHYLEYINKKHASELAQLKTELEYLRSPGGKAADSQELSRLKAELDAAREEIAALHQKSQTNENLDALREELRGLKEENTTLRLQAESAEKKAALAETLSQKLEELRSQAAALSAGQEDACSELQGKLDAMADEKMQLQDKVTALEASLQESMDALAKAAPADSELEAYRRAELVERTSRERAREMVIKLDGALTQASAQAAEASVNLAAIAGQMAQQMDLLRTAINGSQQAFQDAVGTVSTLKEI